MGVAAGADDVDALGTLFEGLDDFIGVDHFVADGVVDLIKNHEVVFAAVDGVAARLPALLRELDVGRISFTAGDFYEAAAHGADFKLFLAKHFGGFELAVVPRTLDELHHQHAQGPAHCAKTRSYAASGLAP